MIDETLFDWLERNGMAELLGQGSHGLIPNPARHNPRKAAQIGVDVEGKAVHAYPARELHAQGGDFPRGRGEPYSGQTGYAMSGEAPVCQGAEDDFLQGAHVPANVAAEALQPQNGIPYDLTGTVVGYVPPSFNGVDLNASFSQEGFWEENVFGVGVAAQGNHRRMFAQDEPILPSR